MKKEPPADTITRLGELALASRLRRLADSLSEEAALLYRDLGTDFQPRWFPCFQTLARSSPLPVTALARAVGLTHTGTRQIAEQMIQAGLVRELTKGRDRRVRLLALTPKGTRLRQTLTPVWGEIRLAAREFLTDAGVDLLGALDRIEALLRECSIMDRARDRLGMPPRSRLEVVPYRPAFRKHFRALHPLRRGTRAADGLLESVLLDDPNGKILRKGGSILFALLDGTVVGTCALRRHRDERIELCLLAARQELDSHRIETILIETAIHHARSAGLSALHFCPGRSRNEYLRLARRLGFRRVPPPSFLHPQMRPSLITMMRDLGLERSRGKEETKP